MVLPIRFLNSQFFHWNTQLREESSPICFHTATNNSLLWIWDAFIMHLESRGITAWDSAWDVIDTQQPKTCLIWQLHDDLHEPNLTFLSVYHILHDFRRLEDCVYSAFWKKLCEESSVFSFQIPNEKKKTHTQVWNDMRVDDDRIVNSGWTFFWPL